MEFRRAVLVIYGTLLVANKREHLPEPAKEKQHLAYSYWPTHVRRPMNDTFCPTVGDSDGRLRVSVGRDPRLSGEDLSQVCTISRDSAISSAKLGVFSFDVKWTFARVAHSLIFGVLAIPIHQTPDPLCLQRIWTPYRRLTTARNCCVRFRQHQCAAVGYPESFNRNVEKMCFAFAPDACCCAVRCLGHHWRHDFPKRGLRCRRL